MSEVLPQAIAQAIHQLGALIWVGSLFFVRLVLLPATKRETNPMLRMRVRIDVYKQMFRWCTVGLLLVWGSGLWRLAAVPLSQLPLFAQIMAGAAAIMAMLHLFAFLFLYLDMEVSVDEGSLIRSARSNYWIRKSIWVNLILGMVAALLGASGRHLPP